MNISGSGQISAGEYNDKISVSGSAKMNGNVRCQGLSCSGAISGTGYLQCTEDVRVSGSMRMDQFLTAGSLQVSGACQIGGDCTVEREVKISGGLACGGELKATVLYCSGKASVSGGIEAEEVKISGVVNCQGLLNAERIEIKMDNAFSQVGSIGGSDIRVFSEDKNQKKTTRMPLLSKLVGRNGGGLEVAESIEGDVIALEKVSAPLVVGRVVAVGADCHIALVQYSEEIEIHPDARVERFEKV